MSKIILKNKHELWRRGLLTWKLHAGQQKVYASLQALPKAIREAVVLISRRWGKSYLGVVMALQDCLQGPGRQVFIIGPDLKQTKRIITPLINKIISDAPKGLIRQSKSDITWHVGESLLVIGGFDTALESLRGMEAYSMYLEESGAASENDYHYTLMSVLGPMLMHSQNRRTHLTTPPRSENHPFITDTMPAAAVNGALHVYTIEDNPLLTKEVIEMEIEAAGGRQSEHCRRELFCEIVRDINSLIVPEFDEHRHVEKLNAPAYTYFLTSIDFGGVKDNHALLLGYYDFERNRRCYLDEEWLGINTSTVDVLAACSRLEERNKVVWLDDNVRRIIDAPGQTLVDIKRLGLACTPPSKGKDSVEDGIQAIRVAFLRDEILIDPRCFMLIQTLKYAQWDRARKDFQRTAALGHCDMLAALSYHFRHLNIRSNPFPPNLGLRRSTHYYQEQSALDTELEINQAFFGD